VVDSPGLIAISGGHLVTPLDEFSPGLVVLRGETIEYAGPFSTACIPPGAGVIETGGRMIVPGFIDLHVHGAGGLLFAAARSAADIGAAARCLLSSGTTAFLATIGSMALSTKSGYAGALDILSRCTGPGDGGGASLLGVYLEGPYLSESMPGVSKAWPKEGFGDPLRDARDLLEASRGTIRIAVVAPEVPEAEALVRMFARAGIIVSLGHSGASYETSIQAIGWGITHATHTFNAMRPFHHRDPGPAAATLLSPHVTNEVIGDGIHLHPAVARLVTEIKPHDKVVLVTDGIGLETAAPGSRVTVAGVELLVADDCATLVDGTLAGGRLPLNMHVRRMVEHAGLSLKRAVELATLNPSRELGLREIGCLAPGKRADIVVLNPDFSIYLACCGGKIQFACQVRGEKP